MEEQNYLKDIALQLNKLNVILEERLVELEDTVGHLGDINNSLQVIASIYEHDHMIG